MDWISSDTAGVNGDGSLTHNGICEDVAVGGAWGTALTRQIVAGHDASFGIPAHRRQRWQAATTMPGGACSFTSHRLLRRKKGVLIRANEARYGELGAHIPPAPPSPPPPIPAPPPPPSPPPPPRMDWCDCACTAAVNRNEDDWSPLALEAYSEPSADTRLYSAYAAHERGAEERPAAHIYVEGQGQDVVRFVESRALSLPMAHVTNNWKLTSTPTLTRSYAPISSMPASFVNACPAEPQWAVEAQRGQTTVSAQAPTSSPSV